MKYSFHYQTDPFSYIGVDEIESREEAILEYKRVASEYKGGVGIPEKEWREILDDYLLNNRMVNGGDFYENLSPFQKAVINEVKKSRKRTKED